MVKQLSHADAVQLYAGCWLEYKENQLVYLSEISHEFKARIKNIENGKSAIVPFNTVDFKPIGNRLGFVNTEFCALFVYRKPVRRFSVGLCSNNIGVAFSQECYMTDSRREAHDGLLRLTNNDIAATIRGDYPDFATAMDQAKDAGGSVAFDRQFAVDKTKNIFYKDKLVGKAKDRTVDGIQLKEDFKYLGLILRGENAKDLRDFRIKKD